MKDLIQKIAQSLVDNPNQVSVKVIEGETTIVLELRVSKEDMGKVIGKKGRIAGAIRTVLRAASARGKKRTILEIVE